MFDFCPSCGQTIEQEEIAGQMLKCIHCGKPIGLVSEAVPPAPSQNVTGALCPACNQQVDVKTRGTRRTFVPHYASAANRKICSQSGKAV